MTECMELPNLGVTEVKYRGHTIGYFYEPDDGWLRYRSIGALLNPTRTQLAGTMRIIWTKKSD